MGLYVSFFSNYNSNVSLTLPNQEESSLAKSALLAFLAELDESEDTTRVTIGDQVVELPRQAVELFSEVLSKMANGESVMLIPLHKELTTQEAADILGVSRPYVVKLLEQGEIPYKKLRRHRRIRFEDLMAYKERSDREVELALDELVAEAQELGMGYD